MPLPLWAETYRTGHAPLDDEHLVLFSELQAIRNGFLADLSPAQAARQLDAWAETVAKHMYGEEKLLDQLWGDAAMIHRDVHKATHITFLHRLMMLNTRLRSGMDRNEAITEIDALSHSSDLARNDFEMVDLLRRQGLLPKADDPP